MSQIKTIVLSSFLLAITQLLQAPSYKLNERNYDFETRKYMYQCHWICTGDTLKTDTTDDGIIGHLIDGFWFCSYEIPQELWTFYMGYTPPPDSAEMLPVTAVTRVEIDTFCMRMSKMTRRHWRLPTKEEWLFVYHGGMFSEGYRYCGSNRPEWVAWYKGTSGGKPQEVGQRIPNEVQIYDMLGNVAEWVTDGDTLVAIGGCCLDPSPKSNPNHLYTNPPPEAIGFRILCHEPQWFAQD